MEKVIFGLIVILFGLFVFVVEESIGIFVVAGLAVIVVVLSIWKYWLGTKRR